VDEPRILGGSHTSYDFQRQPFIENSSKKIDKRCVVKKKFRLISVIVVVVLVAGYLAVRALAGNQNTAATDVQTATVQRGSLASTLGASGNTRSGQSATIVWQTSGKVGEVTLQPGDFVEEDQVLASLDPNTLSAEMIKAKQDLIDAKQALDDLLNSNLQQAQALQAVEDAQEALDDLKQAYVEDSSQAQLALAQAQKAYDDALRTRNGMNYPHTTNALVIEKAETDYLLAKKAYNEALNKFSLVEKKRLIDPERVQALNRLVAAEQTMKEKLATYNWYIGSYSDNEIAQADAELAVAQVELERAQATWDSLQYGTSSTAIALAEATLADAQRAWQRVKDGPSQDDIDAAQAAVDAAQATLDKTQLLAPFAGTITEVDVKTGDLVSSGEKAFRVDDMASLYIDLQISEVDLAELEVGQQATLEFDALSDKVYTGEVTEIGMIGTVSNGVVNFPVTVRVTDADEDIRPGMTASVTIVTDEREDVLLVPNKAILTSAGQRTVTVLFEGQQISIPVTVGLTSSSMSEVTSSQLREGDVVVLNGTTSASSTTQNRGDMIFVDPGGGMGGPGGIIP
jgi:HlyD family secretion protein